MFAMDGCRLPSNASKEWSGTIEKLKSKKARFETHAEKLLAVHRALNRSEGKGGRSSERTRLEKAVLKLKKKADYTGEFLESEKAKAGGTEGGRIGISGKEIQSNVTDNESAKIKGPRGIIQGYNGIAVADAKAGVIVAAEAFGTDYEGGAFVDMLDNFKDAPGRILDGSPLHKRPLLLADTNYFSEDNLQAAKEGEVDVLIPDPHFRERFSRTKKAEKKFGVEDFIYDGTDSSYICPAGKKLTFGGKTGICINLNLT
jgi:uncharacterized protein YdcH (DUF465 family)